MIAQSNWLASSMYKPVTVRIRLREILFQHLSPTCVLQWWHKLWPFEHPKIFPPGSVRHTGHSSWSRISANAWTLWEAFEDSLVAWISPETLASSGRCLLEGGALFGMMIGMTEEGWGLMGDGWSPFFITRRIIEKVSIGMLYVRYQTVYWSLSN